MEWIKSALCRKSICFFIIGAAALAVYLNALDSPFVLDDPDFVVRKLKLRDISNFFQFRELFRPRYFVNLSLALNYQMAGLSVEVFHLTNLALHIGNAVLVFFLARLVFTYPPRMGEGQNFSSACAAPFFAASLFALHPIQSQAVIYISQRAALMACTFYLLAVLCYIAGRRLQVRKEKLYKSGPVLLLCLVFALCAFISKKNAASLPLALLLAEWFFFDNSWAGWKKKLPFLLGLLLLLGLGFAWFAGAFRTEPSMILERLNRLTRETWSVSRWEYLCTQFSVILFYIRLIIFPNALSIDHGYPMKEGFFDGFTPYAFLLLLGILCLGLISAKRYKVAAFSIFWFFIALSVESSILPIRDAMFEHRVYLAFPGAAILLAAVLHKLLSHKETLLVVISCLLLLVSAAATQQRTHAWESELALWRDAAHKAPHHARAWNNYGNALMRKGRQQAAAAVYEKAIEANPRYDKPYCNLGKIYAQQGRLNKAESMFRKSLQRNTRFAEAHNNLAIVYATRGRMEEAIRHFQKALRYDPNRPYSHYNLGKAYLDRNQPQKALAHLLQAIRIKPDIQPRVYYLVGAAHAARKNPEQASKWVQKAMQRGLEQAIPDVQRDPLFAPCREAVLDKLPAP